MKKITDLCKYHPWIKVHSMSWIKQNTLKAKISIRTSQTSKAFLNVFTVQLQVTEKTCFQCSKYRPHLLTILQHAGRKFEQVIMWSIKSSFLQISDYNLASLQGSLGFICGLVFLDLQLICIVLERHLLFWYRCKQINSIAFNTAMIVGIDFYRLIVKIDNVQLRSIDRYGFIERFSNIDFIEQVGQYSWFFFLLLYSLFYIFQHLRIFYYIICK